MIERSPAAAAPAHRVWRHGSTGVALVAAVASAAAALVGALPVLLVDPSSLAASSSALAASALVIGGAVLGACGAAAGILLRGRRPTRSLPVRVLLAIDAQLVVVLVTLAIVAATFSERPAPSLGDLADAIAPVAWAWVPGAAMVVAITTIGAFRTAASRPDDRPTAAFEWARGTDDLQLLGLLLGAIVGSVGQLVAGHVAVRVDSFGEDHQAQLALTLRSAFAAVGLLVGCVAGWAVGRVAGAVRGQPPAPSGGGLLGPVVGLAVVASIAALPVLVMGPTDSAALVPALVTQLVVGALASVVLVLVAARSRPVARGATLRPGGVARTDA